MESASGSTDRGVYALDDCDLVILGLLISSGSRPLEFE